MQTKLQRRHDAEVAAPSANGPEQIGIFVVVGANDMPVGQNDLDAEQIVERHTELRHQPSDAAAEGQSCDSGRRYDPAGRRKPVRLCFPIEMTPQRAAASACRSGLRIGMHVLQGREIDH